MIRMLILLTLLAFAPNLSFAEQPTPQINYIGFNLFKSDKNGENAAVFDLYVNDLIPIMERYGLTLRTYRVVHGGNDHLNAHAITFGTAPDQQSFGAFFADPEFQQLFPTLVEIIEDHVVVFTQEQFSPSTAKKDNPLLLSAAWLRGEREQSYKALLLLEEGTEIARQRHGARLLARTHGMMASRGIVDPVENIMPPDVVAIWNIDDPHGYYDEPSINEFSKKAREYIENSAALWLQPWK